METQNVYSNDVYPPHAEKRFCQFCGSEVVEGCVVCPSCGIYIYRLSQKSAAERCVMYVAKRQDFVLKVALLG